MNNRGLQDSNILLIKPLKSFFQFTSLPFPIRSDKPDMFIKKIFSERKCLTFPGVYILILITLSWKS